jgi:hypothetical protein
MLKCRIFEKDQIRIRDVQKTRQGYTVWLWVHICEQDFNLLHPLLFQSPSNPLFFDLMLLSLSQNEMQPKVGGISFCQCNTLVASSILTSSGTDEALMNIVKRKWPKRLPGSCSYLMIEDVHTSFQSPHHPPLHPCSAVTCTTFRRKNLLCFGYVMFSYGSGSAYLYHGITDPDPALSSVTFKNKVFLPRFFCLLLIEGTFSSAFQSTKLPIK